MGRVISKHYADSEEEHNLYLKGKKEQFGGFFFHSAIHPDDRSTQVWCKSTTIIDNDPASENQLNMLDMLGADYTPDISKAEANKIISAMFSRMATR